MADLLTVAEVARYLALGDYGEQRDTLSEMIDAAQEVIERVTWRSLALNTQRTEYYDGGGTALWTDHAPITSIIALTDDVQYSARSITLTNVIQDTDDNGDNYRKGKVELWKNEGGFGGGRLSARICYEAGWTTTTLPADLRQAWIELVAFWFNNPDRVGVRYGMAGGQSAGYENAPIPTELLAVFKAYRLVR